jgi:hypothetical protein
MWMRDVTLVKGARSYSPDVVRPHKLLLRPPGNRHAHMRVDMAPWRLPRPEVINQGYRAQNRPVSWMLCIRSSARPARVSDMAGGITI